MEISEEQVKQWFKEYPKMVDYKAKQAEDEAPDSLDWPDHILEAGAKAAWDNWGGYGEGVKKAAGVGTAWEKLGKTERQEMKSDFAAGLNVVARHIAIVEQEARTEERIKTWEDAALLMRSVIHTWSQPGTANVPDYADPCRIRVTQEYADAFDAYAQGKGSPAIRVAKQREREERLAGGFSAKLTRLELDGKVIFEQEGEVDNG